MKSGAVKKDYAAGELTAIPWYANFFKFWLSLRPHRFEFPPLAARGFMIRFWPLFMFALLAAGCALPPVGTPAKPAEKTIYRSQVSLPEAKALFAFSRGRMLAKDGDFAGAVAALTEAIQYDPAAVFLRLSLARVYLQAQREEEAIATLRDALVQDPRSAEAEMLLGNIYFRREDDDQAIAHFRRAVELDPEEESAYLHLGVAYARAGEIEKAVDALKEALDRHPDSLGAALTLARLYREIDLDNLAEDLYRQVIRSRPDLELAYIELGGIYEKRGEVDQAIRTYREVLAIKPDNDAIRHHHCSPAHPAEPFGRSPDRVERPPRALPR